MRTQIIQMLSIVIWIFAISIFSCNTPFPDPLKKDYDNDTLGIVQQSRKVLYIIVDGGRGQVVQNANMPNLHQMSEHAIYTWNGIADYENPGQNFTDINGWANMLTGTTSDKHKIVNSMDDNDLINYPSFIKHLQEVNPELETAAFCTSDTLHKYFLGAATVSKILSNDKAVEQEVVHQLNENEESSVIVAEFQSAEKAGRQSSFDLNSQEYLDSLYTVDQYIGNILSALKSRENYSKKKWLIIVASNKGGSGTAISPDPTTYGDAQRNSFILFYNPRFKLSYVPKPKTTKGAGPYIGNAVHLYGNTEDVNGAGGVNIVVQNKPGENDQSVFDMGVGDFTVQAKVKFIHESGKDYSANGGAPFISKTGARYASIPGWCLRYDGSQIGAYIAADFHDGTMDNPDARIEISGGNVTDDNWHTVALVIRHAAHDIQVRLFVDGEKVVQETKSFPAQQDSVISSSPLTFGYNRYVWSDYLSMYTTDIRIFKAALPDDVVQEYACAPGMPATHPNLSDLVGFWSCEEGQGTVCSDDSNGGHEAFIQNTGAAQISWAPFNDVSQNICPDPSTSYYKLVPNSVDIPFEIFQWLGVKVPSSWRLDGRAWITEFEELEE